MSRGVPRVAFICVLALQCLLWSSSRYAAGVDQHDMQTRPGLISLLRRDGGVLRQSEIAEEEECAPLDFPPEKQCAHVQLDICPHADTALSIPYLQSYFCTKPSLRNLNFAAMVVWLIFLFTTLGISASDFFCPNLATIAQELGLDENVAGVTFLAWGNGSPDVFSTFSALRADSGSLAVGELLGAATFITSCVVGSMCIIKPFQVEPYSFLRDVGFFTAAVGLLLAILRDGNINLWEAGVLVLLYVTYVCVVVFGSWWERRQEKMRRAEALLRSEFGPEEGMPEPYHDEPSYDELTPDLLAVPTTSRTRSASTPGPPPRLSSLSSGSIPQRPQSYAFPGLSHSQPDLDPSPPRLHHLPSFSLLGALEFRDVVASLKAQSNTETLHHFERTPLPQYLGASVSSLQHRLSMPPSRSTTEDHHLNEEIDPWDATLVGSGDRLPLNERSPATVTGSPPLDQEAFMARVPSHSSLDSLAAPESPSIARSLATPAAQDSRHPPLVAVATSESTPLLTRPTKQQKVWSVVCSSARLLFPTLVNLRSKSWAGRVIGIFAAPAVLALTVTLPVVETAYEYASDSPEKGVRPSQLITFEDSSDTAVDESRAETALAISENSSPDHPTDFNKYLVAVQCVLGPLFCISILFGRTNIVLLIAAAICGIATAALVVVFADKGNDQNARMVRCFMGFIVAMIWIMAIADEVVGVLDTFGYIFGLSDAIIGLTVFAAGNSVADLVANMSVAVFAPIMGFSACFGSPMLNILLGVGLSGSYIINKSGHPYHLKFSKTLLVSSIGLLCLLVITLIFVPLNGYFLSRRWGVFLIFAYFVVMSANIYVELTR